MIKSPTSYTFLICSLNLVSVSFISLRSVETTSISLLYPSRLSIPLSLIPAVFSSSCVISSIEDAISSSFCALFSTTEILSRTISSCFSVLSPTLMVLLAICSFPSVLVLILVESFSTASDSITVFCFVDSMNVRRFDLIRLRLEAITSESLTEPFTGISSILSFPLESRREFSDRTFFSFLSIIRKTVPAIMTSSSIADTMIQNTIMAYSSNNRNRTPCFDFIIKTVKNKQKMIRLPVHSAI